MQLFLYSTVSFSMVLYFVNIIRYTLLKCNVKGKYNKRKIKVSGEDMKDILASIVKYRQDRGWSEYQLAEEAGLPQSTISSWYRKNMTPSIQSLEKVCSAFGISLSQLFAREGEAMDLTQEQRYLLERWAGLSPEQREALMKLIETM